VPHRYNSASIEGRSPPRVRFRHTREPSAPSSQSLSHSRVSRACRLHTAPLAGAFNAPAIAGAQVKDVSTPLRAWESHPDTAPPTPLARPSLPLCRAVRRGQQQPRGTVPSTPVRPTRRSLEEGRRSPRREDEQLLRARTGLRRDVKPVGAVTSIAIGPVRPSPPSRRHPGHCTNIPDAVGACGNRTPPRRLLCSVRPHVNDVLESSRGRPSNRRPLRCHPRSRSWTSTGHAMTPR
jgi:hypothetical protein